MATREELTDNIRDQLDMLWLDYCADAKRIRKRIEKFKAEYLMPRIQGSDAPVPTLDDLTDQYSSIDSDPPTLTRIAMSYEHVYIWSQKEIAVVIGRNVSTVCRTLKALEGKEWIDRLNSTRKEVYRGLARKRYLYSEDIFNLILDYASHEFIATRIINPRSGEELSPKATAATWDYWDSLRKSAGDWNPSNSASAKSNMSIIFPDDFPDDDNFFRPDSETAKTLKEILSDCCGIIVDNKGMSLILALAVGITDMYHKTGVYVFYALLVILAPTLIYLLYRLHKGLSAELRLRYSKSAAFIMIAVIAWGISFGARVFNGDIMQSAFPQAINKLTARVDKLDTEHEETKTKVAKLDETLNEMAKEEKLRQESIILRAAENATAARQFAKSVQSDSKKIGDSDFARIADACETSLSELDQGLYVQRAELSLAMADVYTLWGVQNRSLALSKYDSARNILNNLLKTTGYMNPEQTVEAYVSLGQLCLLEADIRSKAELLKEAAQYFKGAGEQIDVAPPLLQVMYYSGMGTLAVAQSELLSSAGNGKQKETLLNDAIGYFSKALELDSGTETEERYIARTTFQQLCMAKRKMIDLRTSTGAGYDSLVGYCLETIWECEDEIQKLDPEKEQRDIVYLRLQNVSLHIQLYDITFKKLTDVILAGRKNKSNGDMIQEYQTKCAEILAQSEKEIQNVYRLNGKDERYVNVGYIASDSAMVKYRTAVLVGGDDELFENAFKLYDIALDRITETDNLQQNMFIATNKAISLFKAGNIMGDKDMTAAAKNVAEYYLRNYSNTSYYDLLTVFKEIVAETSKGK